jgi:serine/threonine-protein kinase
MTQMSGRRIGPYALEDKLGAGGMGVVYRARDTVLDRPVAIKMMHPADRLGEGVNLEEAQARFLREARAAARIQSRHVASVMQFGQDVDDEGETIAYIVMEFLKGRPLNKVVGKSGPMPPSRVVHIGVQIAKGMAAAHDLGIIHRDLKPANVMLIEEEGDPDFVKILDFGVAKLTHDQQTHGLTQTGALLGTLPFMAPEQISGTNVDARTDIYSLGIILYRMFTGVTLWDADSLSDIVRHQLMSRPPAMSERISNALFTTAHDEVVLRCLEKDPAARFQTMRELAQALLAAEQSPRISASANNALAPTITAPPDEGSTESVDAARSTATGLTGAGSAWAAALSGAATPATTAARVHDESVFGHSASEAPTLAATTVPTVPTVAATAMAQPPPASQVVATASPHARTPTSTSRPRFHHAVVGLMAAAAVVVVVVVAVALGLQPVAAPQPANTTSAKTTTANTTTANTTTANTTTATPPAAATTPPVPLPPVDVSPATTPPPERPPVKTPPATAQPPAPVLAPSKPVVTMKPPMPKPPPAPEPTSSFKRVHTRGSAP